MKPMILHAEQVQGQGDCDCACAQELGSIIADITTRSFRVRAKDGDQAANVASTWLRDHHEAEGWELVSSEREGDSWPTKHFLVTFCRAEMKDEGTYPERAERWIPA